MTKGKYTKGFTLVELLVVIAIIAILAGALFMVINPTKLMRKARDSKRISEVTETNKVIGAAIADQKLTFGPNAIAVRNSCATAVYTVAGAGWVGGSLVAPISWTGALSDFMTTLPRDPSNVAPLCYYFAATVAGQWEISTVLESSDNQQAIINDGGNQGTALTCTVALMDTSGGNTNCRYEVGSDPANITT